MPELWCNRERNELKTVDGNQNKYTPSADLPFPLSKTLLEVWNCQRLKEGHYRYFDHELE
jgi:hypothetical protein